MRNRKNPTAILRSQSRKIEVGLKNERYGYVPPLGLDEALLQEWPHLRSLACIKSKRLHKGKMTEKLRYYISSLPPEAERHGSAVRAHWRVENKLHWHLDLSFGEDLCKIRADHAAENFSLARKMSLNMLKADSSEKLGVPNKRKLCGWSPEYLLKILGVK